MTYGGSTQDWDYQYDPAGRLSNAALTGSGSADYTYRPDGALTQVSASTVFPESGDTFSATASSPYLFKSANHDVQYDSDNTGRIVGYDGFTLNYDARGRLATATDGNITARYDYDLSGWRVLTVWRE